MCVGLCCTASGLSHAMVLSCVGSCPRCYCGTPPSPCMAESQSLHEEPRLPCTGVPNRGWPCRTKKKWKGPLQYEDSTKELMMLPTDMVRLGCTSTQPQPAHASGCALIARLCCRGVVQSRLRRGGRVRAGADLGQEAQALRDGIRCG